MTNEIVTAKKSISLNDFALFPCLLVAYVATIYYFLTYLGIPVTAWQLVLIAIVSGAAVQSGIHFAIKWWQKRHGPGGE